MSKSILSLSVLCLALFITGCVPSDPTFDFKEGKVVRKTTCDGRKNWDDCYKNAKLSCSKGYTITRKTQGHDNLGGGVLGALVWEGMYRMTYGNYENHILFFECKK